MIVGKLEKKNYKKYICTKKGISKSFDHLKKRYRLQITIEGDRKEQVYYASGKILVLVEKDDGVKYKEYQKTLEEVETTTLEELAEELDMKKCQTTENVLYNDKELYYQH